MEGCCSFKSLIGGVCCYNTRDRKRETEIVPLLSCSKNIASHRSAFKLTGPEDEIDPILCVASMFTKNTRSSTMTICPNHRAKLGLGWTRGSSTRCRVPEIISNHNKGKGVWPKGERGLGKRGSEVILRKTGSFVQVGSGLGLGSIVLFIYSFIYFFFLFITVKRLIPNLSRYGYNIARHHVLLHGRGSTVPLSNNTRMKVSPLKLDHFSTFITSAYVTQDLPFGEKSLKLSSNTETKIPGP